MIAALKIYRKEVAQSVVEYVESSKLVSQLREIGVDYGQAMPFINQNRCRL